MSPPGPVLSAHFLLAMHGYSIALSFEELGHPEDAAEVRAEADLLLDTAFAAPRDL